MTWTGEELARIGGAEEIEIAPRRADGTLRPAVSIWIVRVGDELYVRSWRGSGGAWFRGAQRPEVDVAVDAAYRDKYARHPSYVSPIISEQARATTLKVVPAR